MSNDDDNLTPAELLETAERLFSTGDSNMYRAAILEAVTALEANVRDKAFPALRERLGEALCDWLEEKTRMDFDTRLCLFIPIAIGLKVDKKDRLWNDYKRAKGVRNKVTHTGRKVTQSETRFVIDTVYEWIEYLNQAQESYQHVREKELIPIETVGHFVQASARLERVIYSAVRKFDLKEERLPRRVYPVEELYRLSLIDKNTLQELHELRALRNHVVHAPSEEKIIITEEQVQRLNQIVDEIEEKI